MRMVSKLGDRSLHWWEWLGLVTALAVFATQALIASPHKSAAFDEQYHLAAGYAYLRTGDARLATTHPPLMGLLGGLGLLSKAVVLPIEHPAWAAADRFLFSDVFLWEANPDPQALLVAARRPIVVVGLLLLIGLFYFARGLLGVRASWLVVTLALFDPNLLANSRVVTTDLGLTCFLLLALWRLWAWLEAHTLLNLLLVGLCAGLAMAAKYTGLFFWPAAGLITLLYPATAITDRIWCRWIGLAAMGVVACAVLWVVYGFTFSPLPDGSFPLPLPAPFYWQQLLNTYFRIVNLQGARLDFLLGEASNQGWWYYFPVALAVKTPLPLLLLGLIGLVTIARRHRWRQMSVLWVLPLLFLGLGLTGILTIGYRHILPAIPCLILLAGLVATPSQPALDKTARHDAVEFAPPVRRSVTQITPVQWGASALIAGLLIWLAAGSLRIWPHQEAFFNELAGDWYNWSNLLVDSNLDWGQDLPALRETMAAMGIDEVNLAYFGKAAPEQYGVRYRPLPSYLRFVEGMELNAYNPYQPEPGWYAISASSLRLGLFQPETVDLYAFFRGRRPDARAGYSIYLYNVTYPPELPVVRRVVYGTPIFAQSQAQLGIQAQQRTQTKWGRSPAEATIYPLGEEILPLAAAPGYENFLASGAEFGQAFTLLAYTYTPTEVAPGQMVQVKLVWQVGEAALTMPAPTRGAPLSAFVQVTTEDPATKVAQFDGWSTALRGLETRDVIVQPITIEIGADVAPGAYHIRLGLYSPQSGERLPVRSANGEGDHLDIGLLSIR